MSLQDTIEKLNNLDLNDIADEINNLDVDNIGSWPLPIRLILCVLVFIVGVYVGYAINLQALHGRLVSEESKERDLRDEFERKVNEAANLEAYRLQMIEMEESFEALLRQLPQDTEVPGLLEDISTKGLDSGLTFNAIDLKPEKAEDFYIELPIDIDVSGGYHDFGSFVSGIAGLPRIVTLHDFEIVNAKSDQAAGRGELVMSITAKTYRYKPPGGGKKKKGRKGGKRK